MKWPACLSFGVAPMPPRGFVFAIVVFWVGTTCLLVERSILPRWRAGSAPAYAIELTDEVGSPQVSWEVYRGEAKIGVAHAAIGHHAGNAGALEGESHQAANDRAGTLAMRIDDHDRAVLELPSGQPRRDVGPDPGRQLGRLRRRHDDPAVPIAIPSAVATAPQVSPSSSTSTSVVRRSGCSCSSAACSSRADSLPSMISSGERAAD